MLQIQTWLSTRKGRVEPRFRRGFFIAVRAYGNCFCFAITQGFAKFDLLAAYFLRTPAFTARTGVGHADVVSRGAALRDDGEDVLV